jgi:hypothetical protein
MANVTIDSIVRSLLGDEGKHTTHEYLRLTNIANRGLKELTFDILGDIKVHVATVSSALRIDLPQDFVDYVFMGVVNSDYQIEPIGRNRSIPADGDSNVSYKGPGEYHYVYGGLFGLGGGQNNNGYYVPEIDYENWQIILGEMASGETVYMEYITDGSQSDGANHVHPYAEEALIAWTYWKSIQRKREIPANEKLMAQQEYYRQKRVARARLSAFTKNEFLQQLRKGFKQAPKI